MAKPKKVVTKDELRTLMKSKQAQIKYSGSKKVEHPLAKYNSIGHIICVLCNTPVKTENLWPAHLQSRNHKENLAAIKIQSAHHPSVSNAKRKQSGDQDVDNDSLQKKTKGDIKVPHGNSKGLPADFFDNSITSRTSHNSTHTSVSTVNNKSSRLKTGKSDAAVLAAYSSSESESDGEEMGVSRTSQQSSRVQGMPADFFDSGVSSSTQAADEEQEATVIKAASMAEALPEGFFDDARMDAKVRKVEYRDKMEDEWELFQRTMKQETHVSEAIMDEEDEMVNIERNIDEIDEQMENWREINELEQKKEVIMQKQTERGSSHSDNENSDISDSECDEFLHWRTKQA